MDDRAPPAYLSRTSLAAALDISESTVDEMVRRGAIPPPIKMGQHLRWRAADFFESWRAWNRSTIYVISSGPFVKIGITSDVRKRLRALEGASPYEIVLIASFRGGRLDEINLHAKFGQYCHRGEWFRNEGKLKLWIETGCEWS